MCHLPGSKQFFSLAARLRDDSRHWLILANFRNTIGTELHELIDQSIWVLRLVARDMKRCSLMWSNKFKSLSPGGPHGEMSCVISKVMCKFWKTRYFNIEIYLEKNNSRFVIILWLFFVEPELSNVSLKFCLFGLKLVATLRSCLCIRMPFNFDFHWTFSRKLKKLRLYEKFESTPIKLEKFRTKIIFVYSVGPVAHVMTVASTLQNLH